MQALTQPSLLSCSSTTTSTTARPSSSNRCNLCRTFFPAPPQSTPSPTLRNSLLSFQEQELAKSLLSPQQSRKKNLTIRGAILGGANGSAPSLILSKKPELACSPFSPQQSRKKDLILIRAANGQAAPASTIQQQNAKKGGAEVGVPGQQKIDDRVKHIRTVEEFEEALVAAKRKLVVVEYAATHSENSRKIYPAMVDLSGAFKGVVFLLVLGDESDATRELCERAGVEKVPHFVFYKESQKIHEERGITSQVLEGDVLYYGGDNEAPIYQVHNKKDFEVLLNEHASDNKLVVLDIGMKNCGPCVKIYPTFVKLAKRMADSAVFARMHGDENGECRELLRSMDVVEVPTFLFMRGGEQLGRYVGSGRGELVGEILRHNGVRCT